jgi:alpha-tubulin suppressor-like RCC1 family protein
MPNFSGIWNLKEQVQAIAAGRWTGLPLPELYAWGRNNYGGGGNLGDGTAASKSSPVQIGSLSNWADIAAGGSSSAAVKTDGTLWTWGDGADGRLGDNSTIDKSSPVQIGSLTNWAEVSVSKQGASFGRHVLARKTTGTLWAWGSGGYGALGDNTTINKSSPVQIGALTNWAQIAANGVASAAINAAGELYAWGSNNSGRLGLGDTVNRSSPVQVGALTSWAQVSVGLSQMLSVKTDGTLWAWGSNNAGELGIGTHGAGTNRSSPVQVGVLTNWSQVDICQQCMSVKTDGTLWGWGYNYNGQIGEGTNAFGRSSPVQVGALTNWAQVSSGLGPTACVKTDGTLWGWGKGAYGGSGLGDTENRSSPVQIGSDTKWSSVSVGTSFALSIFQTPSN